jgi:hypothetical protein
MDHMLTNLIVMLVISLVQCGFHPELDMTPAVTTDSSELQELLADVRIGMSADDVEGILGPADSSFPTDEADGRILVWKERWLLFPVDSALVKLVGDRVVLASYSSGNIKDPIEWVDKIETRPLTEAGVPTLPDMLISDDEPWAALDSILDKLDRSWVLARRIDSITVALFDSITKGKNPGEVNERVGPPEGKQVEDDETDYQWAFGYQRMVITFEGEALVSKRLETPDLTIAVREGYWQARDRRERLSVTVHL